MVKVKMCGITNLEDALAAVEFGADALGFVFFKKARDIFPLQRQKQLLKSYPHLFHR